LRRPLRLLTAQFTWGHCWPLAHAPRSPPARSLGRTPTRPPTHCGGPLTKSGTRHSAAQRSSLLGPAAASALPACRRLAVRHAACIPVTGRPGGLLLGQPRVQPCALLCRLVSWLQAAVACSTWWRVQHQGAGGGPCGSGGSNGSEGGGGDDGEAAGSGGPPAFFSVGPPGSPPSGGDSDMEGLALQEALLEALAPGGAAAGAGAGAAGEGPRVVSYQQARGGGGSGSGCSAAAAAAGDAPGGQPRPQLAAICRGPACQPGAGRLSRLLPSALTRPLSPRPPCAPTLVTVAAAATTAGYSAPGCLPGQHTQARSALGPPGAAAGARVAGLGPSDLVHLGLFISWVEQLSPRL
jgi:hypothetical protein